MPKWGFPDLLSSCGSVVLMVKKSSTKAVGWTTPTTHSTSPRRHHHITACLLPLTTRNRNFQQYRTGFSSRRPPARRAPSPSRCGSTSDALYRGKRRMRQARGQRRPPSHTPGFEGSRGPDEGRRGGQRGPKRGSTAMPLADSQTRVAIYATQCDGGIIIVAVPSSRQGLFYCPPTTRGVASTTARYHCSSPEPG